MTFLDPADYEGWTADLGIRSDKSRTYSHPQYAGWEVRVDAVGGVAAIYRDGARVEDCGDLAAAVDLITEMIVPDNRRVDLDGNPDPR